MQTSSIGLDAIVNTPQILVVTGPMASGKSSLALTLAQALSAEIINLDSVQIYRGFDIGSAKATAPEQQLVPHHLIDILTLGEEFSVARYLALADQAIKDCLRRGKVPLFVGGSTMYLTALLHGLADLPASAPEIRAELLTLNSEQLYAKLLELDPERAQELHSNDSVRVIRALETVLSSGKTASSLRKNHRYKMGPYRALILCLNVPRDILYQKINLRSQQMIDAGLVAEVQTLLGQVQGESLPTPFSTIGYLQSVEYLQGKLSQEELVATIAQMTRRYAKRQMTYLRNEPRKRGWAQVPEDGSIAQYTVEDLVTSVRERLAQPLLGHEFWAISL